MKNTNHLNKTTDRQTIPKAQSTMTNISGQTEKAGKLRMMLVEVIVYKAVNRFQTGNRHEIKRIRGGRGAENKNKTKKPNTTTTKVQTNKQTKQKNKQQQQNHRKRKTKQTRLSKARAAGCPKSVRPAGCPKPVRPAGCPKPVRPAGCPKPIRAAGWRLSKVSQTCRLEAV